MKMNTRVEETCRCAHTVSPALCFGDQRLSLPAGDTHRGPVWPCVTPGRGLNSVTRRVRLCCPGVTLGEGPCIRLQLCGHC